MKVTKAMLTNYVKHMLATNQQWATKAMLRVYACQTESEKVVKTTSELNGVGFSGADAEIMSSFCEQFTRKNFLSDKQMSLVFKKMPRYHKQVISFIAPENLTRVQQDALNFSKIK